MQNEITIHSGIRGTRILAGALATMLLRKRGRLKRDGRTVNSNYPKARQQFGRPWTIEETKCARAMRVAGATSEQIGAAINRSAKAVDNQIGGRRSYRRAA